MGVRNCPAEKEDMDASDSPRNWPAPLLILLLVWNIGRDSGEFSPKYCEMQGFSGAKYFHPRPSAAGTGYDPLSSGGSNLGPTSQKLIDGIKANASQYRQENGLPADAVVPADAVTASGSGLDPHISLQNARLQIPRVAKERGLSEEALRAQVTKATDNPLFGIGGDPGVNVLQLNLALDALAPKGALAEKKP
jgi:K+-transporting ATPase KdpC subunit